MTDTEELARAYEHLSRTDEYWEHQSDDVKHDMVKRAMRRIKSGLGDGQLTADELETFEEITGESLDIVSEDQIP